MPVAHDVIDAYLRCVANRDRPGALAVATDWAERHSLRSAIEDVLVPAQVEVGRRWQSARWTVADEHIATGMTDYVLAVIAARFPSQPNRKGAVAVVCAEGEWHTLAARMAAEILRLDGWRVDTLGAVPSVDLGAHLRDDSVIAVAATCSMASNLAGLLRTVQAAHEAGVPVVAGGQAVDATRAARVGADAYSGDAATASAVLGAWEVEPPVALVSPAPLDAEYFGLEARRTELGDAAMLGVLTRFPDLAGLDTVTTGMVREDLDHLIRFLASGLVADDRSVLSEALTWFATVYRSRQLPARLVAAVPNALVEALDDGFPQARATLIEGLRSVQDRDR